MPHRRTQTQNQRLLTQNGHYFQTGSGALRTTDGAITFVMNDDVLLVGWWMEANMAIPIDVGGFVQAEMSLVGKFKGELVSASAAAGLTNAGGTLEVLTVEFNREQATAASIAHSRLDARCSTMLPKELWVPLEKQDSVYVNVKANVEAGGAENVRAGLWLFELAD